MHFISRYPLSTGAAVVGAVVWVVQVVTGSWVATGVVVAVVAAVLCGVGYGCGVRYAKENWRDRRTQLTYTSTDEAVTTPFPAARTKGIAVTIVAPCYNEEERIGRFIQETADYLKPRGTTWELLIVDDGSKDKSIATVLSASKKLGILDNVKVVPIKPNRGKGYVVKQGVFASSGDVILMADSDAATDITELGNLEAYLAEHKGDGMGVVIGSRAHLEEESKATRSGPRLLLMHLFHFCVSFTFAFADTHTELQDTQCGFKLFTREAALRTFSNLYLERWSFDVELLVAASRLGIKVGERQVKWEEIDGSKMSVRAMVRMGMELLLTCFCVKSGLWHLNRNVDVSD